MRMIITKPIYLNVTMDAINTNMKKYCNSVCMCNLISWVLCRLIAECMGSLVALQYYGFYRN